MQNDWKSHRNSKKNVKIVSYCSYVQWKFSKASICLYLNQTFHVTPKIKILPVTPQIKAVLNQAKMQKNGIFLTTQQNNHIFLLVHPIKLSHWNPFLPPFMISKKFLSFHYIFKCNILCCSMFRFQNFSFSNFIPWVLVLLLFVAKQDGNKHNYICLASAKAPQVIGK